MHPKFIIPLAVLAVLAAGYGVWQWQVNNVETEVQSAAEQGAAVEGEVYNVEYDTDRPSEAVMPTAADNSVVSAEIQQQYGQQEWYDDVIRKVTSLPRANEYDRSCTNLEGETVPCVSGAIAKKDIGDMLYLENEGVVLVIVPGVYGGEGFKLLRYNAASKAMRIAIRQDAEGGKETDWYKKTNQSYLENAPDQAKDAYAWFGTPDAFADRDVTDGVVELTGETGDAGCFANMSFAYDIASNYLYITQRCSGCFSGPGGEAVDEQCEEFQISSDERERVGTSSS